MANLVDPWKIVMALLAIVAIIISVILYRKQRQGKEVSYTIVSSVPLIGVKEEIRRKLQILFNGKPVEQVHLVEVDIVNSGNSPIKASEYERPISLGFGEEAEIFTAEVAKTTPESLWAKVRIEENKVLLEPTLLNEGDSVRIKMLVAKFAQVNMDGRIVGVKEINEFKESRTQYWVLAIIGSIFAVVGLGIQSVSPEHSINWNVSFAIVLGGFAICLLGLRKL